MSANQYTELLKFRTLKVAPIWEGVRFRRIGETIEGNLKLTYDFCERSGLVFMNPRPTEESMSRFYSSFYWDDWARKVETTKAGNDRRQIRRAQGIVGRFQKRLLGLPSRTEYTVLEVGSSFGCTLVEVRRALAAAGRKAKLFGIEPSSFSIQQAEENYKHIEVIGRSAMELEHLVSGQMFDIIILSHVLEHLHDPEDTLRRIRSRLAPDGLFYLEVPNFYFHPSYSLAHLLCFSETTLLGLIRKVGFEVLDFKKHCYNRPQPTYLTAIVRVGDKQCTFRPESFQVVKAKRLLGLCLNRCQPGRLRNEVVKRLGASKRR